MAIINPVSYLQNRTDHTGQTDRLGLNALLQEGPSLTNVSWRPGCIGANDMKVVAAGTPNMTVIVGPGQGFVTQAAAGGGAYACTNDANVTLTITAAHASLPRRDLIILRVEDSFYVGAVNQGSLQVVTGTAAASPTDPAVTGNYILLARVTVAAAATSITNGVITDIRPRTGASNGILWLATTAERDALTNIGSSQLVYVAQTDGFYGRSAAGTWVPLWEDSTWQVPTAFGGNYSSSAGFPLQYRKVNGRVQFRGRLLRSASPSVGGESMMQIASGFRPVNDSVYPIATSSPAGNVNVLASGLVTIQGAVAATTYVFDSVGYLVD